MSKKARKLLLDAAAVIGGDLVMALGLVIFTIPNNLAPGGVSGLATALAQIMPVKVGLLSFLLNLPILLVGWKMFGWRRIAGTCFASALFSAFIDLLTPYLFTYTGDLLLSSVMGGVLLGAGIGVLFARGLSSGGTDLLALLLRRPFPQLKSGKLLVVVDACVIAIAAMIFKNIESALYSAVTVYVSGKVIDAMLQGVDYAKVIMIITQKPEEILRRLADEMGRGVTEFTVKGGYTREHKSMLMTVARRSEISTTLRTVKEIDPASFVILHDATEVHGEGFKEEIL